MISTFGSTYFGNQYILGDTETADLAEVVDGSTKTVTFYNASDVAVSQPITLGLEDGTFEVTWTTQSTALTSASDLTSTPLEIPAHDSETITIEFGPPGRDSVQTAVVAWAGASLTLIFKRLLRVSQKPQGDVTEKIEFKTDVSEAWDGTEQRTRLRASARATLSQDFLLPRSERAAARDFQAQAMGLTSRRVKLALWHRAQKASMGGEFNLEVSRDDVYSEWDPALLALSVGDSVLIEEVATGQLFQATLGEDFTDEGGASSPAVTFPPGVPAAGDVLVIPEATALLDEGAQTDVYPNDAVRFRSRWTYNSQDFDGNELDASDYYSALAPETFNGRPILREGNLIGSSLGFAGDSGAIRFDKKIGVIDTFHRRESSTITFDRMFEYAYDEGKIEALRQFVFWTQGRQRSFYVPSGTEDLFATAVSGNVLTVMGIGLGGIAPLLDGYAAIEATLSTDGSKSQYAVTANAADTATDTVELTLDLAGAPNPSLINFSRIEFLYHVRLASDKVQFKYDGREAMGCKFKVQTVKQ